MQASSSFQAGFTLRYPQRVFKRCLLSTMGRELPSRLPKCCLFGHMHILIQNLDVATRAALASVNARPRTANEGVLIAEREVSKSVCTGATALVPGRIVRCSICIGVVK